MANGCKSENHVAEAWWILMLRRGKPALRNIFLAATYAPRCCMQHLWVHARRDFLRAAQRHPELQAWSERWLKRFAGLYTRNARRLAHFKRRVAMSAQPPAFVAAHRRLKRKVLELFETAKRELHEVPGAQMRYFVRATNGDPLAVLGFGAAAWKTAPRDAFIGWSPAQRQRNLALVVNNARFLIVPWIRIHNLASHLLAQLQRRLLHDWERRYALRPVLLETFCETPRFLGTCYQSANWLCVGETQGRGKLDVHRQSALPVKSVWLKPLQKNWRAILCR